MPHHRPRLAPAALTTIVHGLATVTARHPEIARLLVTEGIRGGPRLRQILTRMTPLRAALDSLAGPVDPDTLFLTLLLLTATSSAPDPRMSHIHVGVSCIHVGVSHAAVDM